MTKWKYEISTSTVNEVFKYRDRLGLTARENGADVFYCDPDGQCFFDEMPNPEITALTSILDARGNEGWELIQVVYHKKEMVCFWKRQVNED